MLTVELLTCVLPPGNSLLRRLCIFEQHTVKTTFENMETLLQSMDAAAAEENYPEAERKARQLQNIWTARYPTLCVLMEHRALQEAGVTLGTLQPLAGDESDDLRPTIRQCQTELAEIYDNSKVTVGNIF